MSIKKVNVLSGTKWEVRVRENGRGSKKLARRFDRRIEAEHFLTEFRREQKEKLSSPFKTKKLNEVIFKDEAAKWLEDGKIRFSPSHVARVSIVLRKILPAWGDLTLDKFTPDFINAYQRQEKELGLKNETVNKQVQVVASVLNFSVKRRAIPFNPTNGYQKLKVGGGEMFFWSQQEAQSFLTFTDLRYPKGSQHRWVHVVYLVALNTGLRAGELWGLKILDISAEANRIFVRRQFEKVIYGYAPTKGRNTRAVPANKNVISELTDITQGAGKDMPVFRNEVGNPIHHDNFIGRKFDKDLKDWGGRVIRFHDLRHTAITLLMGAGIDIRTIKEISGHADIKTTMNYLHLIPGQMENVANTFSIVPETAPGA
jgi:integrase